MLAFAPSVVTLGFALASLAASQTSPGSMTESERLNFTTPGAISENGSISETMENSNQTIMSSTMSYMNATTPWMDGRGNTSEVTSNETTPPPMTTPKIDTTKMTRRPKDKSTTTAKPYTRKGYDTAGIVILIVILVVAIGLGIACFISRRRARRYAVDFSRVDETNVPLSPVDPMLANDGAPHNSLQTFERSKDEKKEEATTDVVENEAKAEAESASLPKDDSQDKDAKDAEPVKPNDPDQQKSDGTVGESPKNENNSNNSDVTQKKDFKSSTIFGEISLNSPV
ncbi:uncharacterized protein [Syngnathus scovelli]|uniref:uncharacterized protein n=1 Tax=Syngnathus scovelli TaxID=161590 RepID=UPI00210FD777|nr:uncharacterized protein si:dkey-27h10.2 [Syngnathus scovelli]